LPEQAEDSFRILPPVSSGQQADTEHSRVETRRCRVINNLSFIEQTGEWKGLKCPVKTASIRYFKYTGREEKETCLYTASLEPDALPINKVIRLPIENSLHWVPDAAFHEGNSRKRSGFAAQNYSMPNQIALNLLKDVKTFDI
jgi:hypothetical protein